MDYQHKYLKYKSKYIQLKNQSNQKGGMKNMTPLTRTYINRNDLTSKSKNYYIHDNGGRPFRVSVNQNEINIYKKIPHPEEIKYSNEPFVTFSKFSGYWEGYDTSLYKYTGNSILIKLDDHHYVYVGWEIYQFSTSDTIIDFISPVGNNDVPYSFAYGEKNLYLLTLKKFVSRKEIDIDPYNASYIYDAFYDYEKKTGKKGTTIRNIQMISQRL